MTSVLYCVLQGHVRQTGQPSFRLHERQGISLWHRSTGQHRKHRLPTLLSHLLRGKSQVLIISMLGEGFIRRNMFYSSRDVDDVRSYRIFDLVKFVNILSYPSTLDFTYFLPYYYNPYDNIIIDTVLNLLLRYPNQV